MALRIKQEHIGKSISVGGTFMTLSAELSQREIMFVKNMVNSMFVEEYDEAIEKAKKEVEAYVTSKSWFKRKKNA